MAKNKKIKVTHPGIHNFEVVSYQDKDNQIANVACKDCGVQGVKENGDSYVICPVKNKEELENITVCKALETHKVYEQKEKMYLKYTFTESELSGLSKKLAGENMKLERVEEEKKSIVSDFASQINNIKKSISILSQQVNAGHEYRYVDCMIKYHDPEQDLKTIYRIDTGEVVETIQMIEEDYNLFNQM